MASGRDPGRAIERANRESTLVQLAHEVGRIRGSQMHGASRGERAHHVIGFRWTDADPGYQAEHALHPRYLRFKHLARPFQVMIGRGQLQQARAERGGGRAFGYLGDAAGDGGVRQCARQGHAGQRERVRERPDNDEVRMLIDHGCR